MEFKDESSRTPLLYAIARKKDRMINVISSNPLYNRIKHFDEPIKSIIDDFSTDYLLRFKKYITGEDTEIFDLKNKKFNILIKLYNRFPD